MKGNGHNTKNVGYIEAFHGGRREDGTSERRLGSSRVDGTSLIKRTAGIDLGAKAGRSLIRMVLVTFMDSRVMKIEST